MRKRRSVLLVLALVLSASLAHASTPDTKPPLATFQTTDGTIAANAYPVHQDLIGGSADDDASGIANVLVTYTAAGSGLIASGFANIGCTDETMRSCLWRIITPLQPGEYVVTARATDRAGNVQPTSARVTIISV